MPSISIPTATAISAGLGAAGAGVSAIGAISGGAAQAAEARYQAAVASNNAMIANQKAQYATQAGEVSTYNTGLRERAKAGQVTTGIAANNIDVNTGSARDVRTSQAEMGQLEEETTQNKAAVTAYGYRVASTGFQAESQLQRAEAPQDVAAGFLGGAGTLLSGASNIGFKWGQMNSGYGANPGPGTGGPY
jgi:hypothetical protein